MVVPAGEFTMGSSEEDRGNHALSLGLFKPWFADESPEHRLFSNSYFMVILSIELITIKNPHRSFHIINIE